MIHLPEFWNGLGFNLEIGYGNGNGTENFNGDGYGNGCRANFDEILKIYCFGNGFGNGFGNNANYKIGYKKEGSKTFKKAVFVPEDNGE